MILPAPSYRSRAPAILLGLALAGGLGFGVARVTAPAPQAPPKPAPPPSSSAPVLDVPAAYLTGAGVTVEPVTAGSFAAEVQALGAVHSSPAGEAVSTATAAGVIVRLSKRLGDPVRAGEVIAVVESREAAGLAADRMAADARVGLARQVAAREQNLYEQRVSPRQDLETARAGLAAAEAEAGRARMAAASARVSGDGRTVSVTSPITGRITAESAALGAFVQPGAPLFRVTDPRLVQVEAAVAAADAARISVGDPAELTTSAGARLTAVVRSITPSVDEVTRAATVVLSVAGGGATTPGETVRVLIRPRAAGPTALVVADEAVQRIGGRDVVFVRTSGGFRVQPVIVGARSGGRVSVLSGLSAGQAIAVHNAFLLKAELGKGEDEE